MSIKIAHPNIISPVYELVKVLEFNIDLQGIENFPVRLEIFRSLEDNCRFRAHIWRTEFFRIQSSFPLEDNKPSHDPADEEILLDFSHYLRDDYNDFNANSLETAIELIIEDLKCFLDKTNYGYNQQRQI